MLEGRNACIQIGKTLLIFFCSKEVFFQISLGRSSNFEITCPLIGIIIADLTAIWADRNVIWFFISPFYFLNTPTNHRENMTRVHNMSSKKSALIFDTHQVTDWSEETGLVYKQSHYPCPPKLRTNVEISGVVPCHIEWFSVKGWLRGTQWIFLAAGYTVSGMQWEI